MSKYNPYTRRAFLHGLGGSLLSIPFLPSIFPSVAQAQGLPPLRYLQVFSILGRDMDQWYPSTLPTTSYQGMNDVYYSPLAGINGPLSGSFGTNFDSVRSKMSILRGLDSMTKVKQPNGAISTSSHHNNSIPSTGVQGYEIGLGDTFTATFPYSVDAVLEESTKIIPAGSQFGALRLKPHTRQYSNLPVEHQEGYGGFCWTSKSGKGQQLPCDWNLQTVFDKWFKNLGTVQPPPAQDPRLARRKFITDLVVEDYKAVQTGRRISAEDKYRLDNYLSLLNDLEVKLANLGNSAASGNGSTCMAPGTPGTYTSALKLHQVAADMVVAAFACGLTKVASHTAFHYKDDPLAAFYAYAHDAAHIHNSNWPLMSKFRAQVFADILVRLNSFPDGAGTTLLDNTVVMYGMDEADGSHNYKDLPVIVAGGTRILNQGNYIDYRPRPLVSAGNGFSYGRPLNQLMVTIFQAMGLTAAEYQKLGATGFATYDDANANMYSKYTATGYRNTPLPLLFKG
jgi:hypothetical protein